MAGWKRTRMRAGRGSVWKCGQARNAPVMVAGTSGAPVSHARRAAPSRSRSSIQPARERLPSGKIPTRWPATTSALARSYASRPLPGRTSTGNAPNERMSAPSSGTRNSASHAMKWMGRATSSDSRMGSR